MEIQMKTTVRNLLMLVKWVLSKKLKITSVVEKREPLYTVGRNVNWCIHYRKHYAGFSKIFKQNQHMAQQFHLWVSALKKKPSKKDHKEAFALPCSSQHCLQEPRHEKTLRTYLSMEMDKEILVYTRWGESRFTVVST